MQSYISTSTAALLSGENDRRIREKIEEDEYPDHLALLFDVDFARHVGPNGA